MFVEDKLEDGLLRAFNDNEVKTKRHFSCFGCSYKAARFSQISQHLDLQVPSSKNISGKKYEKG